MKVLFVTREDAERYPGGDVIQLIKTADALRNLGVDVQLGTGTIEQILWADIVHFFGVQQPENFFQSFRLAREQIGKKVVVSPIWWDLSHAKLASQLGKRGLSMGPAWRAARHGFHYLQGLKERKRHDAAKYMLQNADLLLPNSVEEQRHVERDFGNLLPPYRVVMNAVDSDLFRPSSEVVESGVICLARVEPTKNQIHLIRAVSSIPGLQLTIVGKMGGFPKYNSKFSTMIDKYNYRYLPHVPQSEVVELLHQHAVHALPSFRESPGLSSLEATASGLNVVVSSPEFAPVKTYFGSWLDQRVFVCNPYSSDSIRHAIHLALMRKSYEYLSWPDELTWNGVGIQTINAYKEI